MIVKYKNQRLTDNTVELDQADLFLLTKRNKRYFDKYKSKIEFIKVKDLIKEWGLDQIKFIGVTGTNGKTTVATAICHILNRLSYRAANQGTSGLFFGTEKFVEKKNTTPEILETLANAKKMKDEFNIQYFVMEASSHAIEQNRIEGIDFAVKVHTNITSDHLDYHGTIEEYRRIKNSFLADKGKKVINIDDKFVKFNPKNATTYFFQEEIKNTPLVGKFNTYNLLAAIKTVQILLGDKISEKEILETLVDFKGMPGRMEVVSRHPLIIVDFAHTDDGMEKVLTAFPGKKIAVVFGAGGDRDNSKRPKMGAVAEKYAQKIYVTSDNPRTENPEKIVEQILAGIKKPEKIEVIVDRKEAIKKAIQDFQNKENDILLILGRGDETHQEIMGKKIPFDDREVIRNFLDEKN